MIAREHGGGGHRRAAGFTTTLALDELIAGLRSAIAAARRREPARKRPLTVAVAGGEFEGVLLVDKPVGPTSHDIVARVRRSLGGGRPATRARSTRSPAACC